MKKQQPSASKPAPVKSNRVKPENKDNLDSRKNEEQDFKGADVTHNKKETRKQPR